MLAKLIVKRDSSSALKVIGAAVQSVSALRALVKLPLLMIGDVHLGICRVWVGVGSGEAVVAGGGGGGGGGVVGGAASGTEGVTVGGSANGLAWSAVEKHVRRRSARGAAPLTDTGSRMLSARRS